MGKAARAVRTGVQSEFMKKFESLSGRYSVRQIWEDWVVMYACAISNTVDKVHAEEREKQYMQRAQKYSKKELQVFAELCADMVEALEIHPNQDFLGEMYMAVGMGCDSAGQFFTPYDVCRCMAEITTNADYLREQINQRGWVSVSDPTCGAGALLVAFANVCRSLEINYQTTVLFVAQDIDFLVGCMCYLQLSLLGCPGYVVIDNSLTKPSTSYDDRGLIPRDDGNVWYTPFYFREEWHIRRLASQMGLFFGQLPEIPADEEPADDEPPIITESVPLQPLPAPEPAPPPVTITPEPESPVEAEEIAYSETTLGQLTFF